ncbi:hypothetical protein Q604_UNBC11463G0001, partial [human gut metagenome]
MKDGINIITILLPTIEAPLLVKMRVLGHSTMFAVVYGMFYLLSHLILKEEL